MKKNVLLGVLLFLGLILQETWMYRLRIGSVQPDLLLIFVVFYALFYGGEQGARMGLIVGLSKDLFLGHHIGLYAICLLITGWVVGLFSSKFYEENYVIAGFAAGIASLLANYLHWFGLNLLGNGLPFWAALTGIFFPAMIYNLVVAIILYVPLFLFYTNRQHEKRRGMF